MFLILRPFEAQIVLILRLTGIGTWFPVICTKSMMYYRKTISTLCMGCVCTISEYSFKIFEWVMKKNSSYKLLKFRIDPAFSYPRKNLTQTLFLLTSNALQTIHARRRYVYRTKQNTFKSPVRNRPPSIGVALSIHDSIVEGKNGTLRSNVYM